MRRMLAIVLAGLLLAGCAGTRKLTEKSEQRLAGGDHWRAWQLATRALDKEPGNPRARAAATAAGASIAQEWERRIRALAGVDSVEAAGQVLEFASFRGGAARYATIPVSIPWPAEERALKRAAARVHYANGAQAAASRRPKKAHFHFTESARFVPGYRDAETLAQRAMEKALTRVAVVPFRGGSGLGADLAEAWRQELGTAMTGQARYTRLVPGAAVDREMSVDQLGRVTREEAIRLGRKAGAQRVVWGSIGEIESKTRLEFFRDVVSRRVREKNADGTVATRWVDVPIEVVARLRDVSVDVNYEVIATRDGAILAEQRYDRSTAARVVWTSYQPEDDIGSYALVSETVRSGNPDRAQDVERRWKAVCGEATLRQVLEARVASTGRGRYDRGVLSRFATGAAFVFLEELPPADDLALAALSDCRPLTDDLLRLDAVDDVDLGAGTAGLDRR